MLLKLGFYCVLAVLAIHQASGYSALKDARIIAEYKRQQRPKDHARVARSLVHQANWSPLGTISTNEKIPGFPMVNTVSIDDSTPSGKSTGKIRFLLTDIDFTGRDWHQSNKVTFLVNDEINLNCKAKRLDPMEPTCARAILSGQVVKLDKKTSEYSDAAKAFVNRHPSAKRWLKVHSFYLCELKIENIFVIDYYGGHHDVTPEEYYAVKLDDVI